MKKIVLILALCAMSLPGFSRSLNVTTGGGNVVYSFAAPEMGSATYDSSTGFTIRGRAFTASDIVSMAVEENDVAANTVEVSWTGAGARVVIAGNVARLVDVLVDGGHVSITQSAETGDETGEISYSLSGTSGDGSFTLTGSYKATLELRGLTLTSTRGAAIDLQNGKRIALSAKNGTENFLVDSPTGSQKAALYCKGHLELKGKGSLTVSGMKGHAISAKEYVEVKNLTLTIPTAAKDGINCAQYYLQESGTVTISGVADDGIQTDYKDAENREEEDTGSMTVSGGSLTIAVTGNACKGMKAEGNVKISGGTINITTTGKGIWDSAKAKTKASSCIGSDENIEITGGTLTLSSTGSGGKGLSPDGLFTMTDGDLNITTSGGVFAYVNGTEYDGYTGNTDNLNSDYKSSAKGIKADSGVTIDGGTIHVVTTGKGAEGIESKGTLTVNGGSIYVKAYDDAINSASHLYIKGGETTVISTNNDGLDANGSVYIQGGKTMAFGGRSPECGIDANSEQGYTVFFTGGELLAVGGSNSVPTTDASTQAYVSTSASTSAGNVITLKKGDEVLTTFTVPADYTSTGSSGGGGRPGGGGGAGGQILVTCPGIVSGQSYTLSNGSSITTVTGVQKGSGRPW